MTLLKPGSTGAAVKVLQQNLQLLRYPVTTDGNFGAATSATVLRFQKDHGLLTDGIVGNQTWQKLEELCGMIIHGIDISHLNGPVNWKGLAADGISFVFCKASEGISFRDGQFQANFSELGTLTMVKGAYHFMHFKDAPAAAQASNFLGCGVKFDLAGILPPVLDVEWQANDALNQYIVQNRAACIGQLSEWLETVAAQTGRTPMIYTNDNFWHDFLGNPPGFGQYPLWIAAYEQEPPALPSGWKQYDFWQFTGNGGISSVTGEVDRDIFNGPLTALRTMSNY